jgi:hypothetical protein
MDLKVGKSITQISRQQVKLTGAEVDSCEFLYGRHIIRIDKLSYLTKKISWRETKISKCIVQL